ncbi:MAG: serine/threonine-protein kinase [Pirellulales bacterium]
MFSTMPQCPQCGRPTSDAAAPPARCAHCGAELAAEKPGTVADVRIDQTMDFGTMPGIAMPASDDVSPDPKTGTVHEAHGLQTANFDVLFGSAGPPDLLGETPVAPPTAAAPAAAANADEPKTGTVHEAHGLQTANFSMLFSADEADDAKAPAASQSDDAGKKTGLNDANIAATFDSGQIGSSLVEQLSMIWGGELEDPAVSARPQLTIKGKDLSRTRSDQTLVINSRAVRDNRQPSASVAGTPPTLADYELLSLLGEGGMGVVYTARQASIDRTVAVKMLKPGMSGNRDLQQKFLAEAVVTGDLDHPNIVPMYDLGKNEAGDLFYAMKRVQGTPWSKAIAAKSQSENVEILLKAADAVAFAHSRGVIHRDLKPENIMLGEFGEVLVMDWGLAYSTAAFRKSASITQTTSMGGSPAYMAPEMALGPIQRVSFASDIYLLGAILYEILTGKPPHTGGNVTKCLMSAARNEILPTDKTGELVDVALKAMGTQPADRYPTVAAFQAAIRECLAHSESLALTHRAEEELAKAAASSDYQNYSRALFGYEEAFALWSENDRAHAGVQTAKLRYAEAAFAKGDYDLAAGLLERSLPAHAALGEQIARAQAERDARQARLRRAKQFVALLGAAVLVIGVVAYFGIRSQRDRAEQAEDVAVAEAGRARDAQKIAVSEAANARTAEGQAVTARIAAEKARQRRRIRGLRRTHRIGRRPHRRKRLRHGFGTPRRLPAGTSRLGMGPTEIPLRPEQALA